MKERKGDARIYVISCFFFLCIICGGVLLGLYIFLPQTFSESWYAIAGMVLVGIPWLFWLSAYLYRCFSPTNNNVYNHPSAATAPSSRTTPATVTATTSCEEKEEESPVQSPVCPGRHVHFGAVVVMGSQGNNNKNMNGSEDHQVAAAEGHLSTIPESEQGELMMSDHEMVSKKASVGPRESEIPFAYSSG